MTQKEQRQFEAALDKVAWRARMSTIDECARITLPLEIAALERMRDTIQLSIKYKEEELQKLNSKK